MNKNHIVLRTYSVTYTDIFWRFRFQQEVWGRNPPEIQNYIIAIFGILFLVWM